MRKKQRLAFLAIGGLGLLAAIAPGLAATLTVPTDVPAAGQGAIAVEGFTVSDIDWTVDGAGVVTQVQFDIVRKGARTNVIAVATENAGDAIVRVRLETGTTATYGSWVACSVPETSNRATCDTSTSTPTVTATALEKVNFIAFDRTPPA
jgi:hypothetical protein